MKKVILILVLLFISSPVHAEYKFAENWTKTDTAYQATFLAITAVDWMQTRWMAKNDWQWDGEYHHESNPILGDYPDSKRVDTLVPLGMLAHTIVSMALPPDYRRIWQVLWIGVEGYCVTTNYSAGVHLEF